MPPAGHWQLASLMAGELPPVWRPVLEAVPRHLFIPTVIWGETPGGLVAVNRDDNPQAWWDLVYRDDYVITQVDDGHTRPGQVGRYASSSSSMPSMVARMLATLDLHDGMSVLEIGTGTGWNAALLCTRLGDDKVTTIEVDPDVAEQAIRSLASAGCYPLAIAGNGEAGYPPNAPYDRIISTCAVQRVPYAWIEQTRPGGVIVTPWGTPYHNGVLLRLVAHEDGTARGKVVDDACFMWARGQRAPLSKTLEDLVAGTKNAEETMTTLHPYAVLSEHDAAFWVGLHVACAATVETFDDNDPQHYTVWLFDPASGSWASLAHSRSMTAYPVRQHGPRRLWNEVEQAYQAWREAGEPARTSLRVTVTPDGQTTKVPSLV